MTRPARSPIPQGVATFLPVEAGEKRAVEDIVFSVFREHGYREVIPPTFEYLDILAPGLDAELIEKSYKVVDRATGRILVVRPDVTAQIARMVAMGMVNQPFPLRLCYSVNVFRYEPEHAGRDREIFQIGLELIGPKGTAADVEPIMVAAECLRRLGVTAFTIAIGQGAFFNALLRRTGVAESVQRSLREAAARKDVPKMEVLLHQAGVRGRAAKALLAVPELYGGTEILEEAARLAPPTEDCRRPLARLREVWERMTAAGLSGALLLDMGEIRRMEYYTGLVFDIYVDGVGAEIGGGGRYDHLIGRFGREIPSTGFAFDLDRLLQLRAAQGGRARTRGVRGHEVAVRARRATRRGRR